MRRQVINSEVEFLVANVCVRITTLTSRPFLTPHFKLVFMGKLWGASNRLSHYNSYSAGLHPLAIREPQVPCWLRHIGVPLLGLRSTVSIHKVFRVGLQSIKLPCERMCLGGISRQHYTECTLYLLHSYTIHKVQSGASNLYSFKRVHPTEGIIISRLGLRRFTNEHPLRPCKN